MEALHIKAEVQFSIGVKTYEKGG